MGYRNYLTIIKKEDFKKITSEYIENKKDEDEHIIISELLESVGAIDIYELGKYSDEGAVLEKNNIEIPEDIKDAFNIVKKHCDNYEYGFNLVTKDDYINLINSYKNRAIKNWQDLLKEKDYENEYDERTREQRLVCYVQGKLTWQKYYIDASEDKTKVQGTWFYEFGVFDLVHNLKTIDWDNYLMFVYGW